MENNPVPLHNFRPFSLLLTGTPGWLCNTILSRLGESLPALTRVRCLVRPALGDEQIAHWRIAHPSVTEVTHGELLDPEALDAACSDLRGGVVVHAASVYHPAKPAEWLTFNRDGTTALARAAKEAGVRRFIFISSTEAQGSSSFNALLTEEMPCYPNSGYGRSKLAAEELLKSLEEPGVFDVVVIRPSRFYGTPVSPNYLRLFKDIRAGRARMVSHGRIARSLSHVEDLADGIIAAMVHPAAAGETFNLCDAQNYTQAEILHTAAACLGVKPRFRNTWAIRCALAGWRERILISFDRYDPDLHDFAAARRHTGATCRKAQQLLGFAPRHGLKEGIKQMVDWAVDQNLI